jgi:hypothetical protein
VISFRQHVVTIVAVFLALALGMLAGSAFVQPRLVDQLQAQVEQQRGTMDELRAEVTEFREALADEQVFTDAALPHLTEGRLLARDALVIAQDGTEDGVVSGAQQALEEAGASVVVLTARETLAPVDPDDQAELAELLALPGVEPEDLPRRAAEALADRLASTVRRGPGDPDLLRELLTQGYLAPGDTGLSGAAVGAIGGPGQVTIVLAGGQIEDPLMAPEDFAVPLVQRLAELGVPVAAGESVDALVPFVPVLRAGGLDGLVTVDDLDERRGGAALVLGLERLLLEGDGGDYGVKDGAVPLPPPP